MKQKKPTDHDSFTTYEASNGTRFDLFYDLTTAELRDVMAFLIAQREELRDSELKKLEEEAAGLIGKLQEVDRRKLLEELTCFKDVLALQRRALEKDDLSGDRGKAS